MFVLKYSRQICFQWKWGHLFLCSITLIEKEHLATKPQSHKATKPQSHKATKPWVHSVWSNRSTICSQISCICTHWIGVRSCFQTKNLKFVIIGKHKLRNRLVHISHQIIFAFTADPAALNKLNRIDHCLWKATIFSFVKKDCLLKMLKCLTKKLQHLGTKTDNVNVKLIPMPI